MDVILFYMDVILFYKTHKLYEANTPLSTPKVWLGDSGTTSMGIAQPLYVTIPTGQYKNIKVTTQMQSKTLKAPVTKGQTYGNVLVKLGNDVIATRPLIALKADPVGGMWTRMTGHIAMFFHSL